MGEYQAHPLGRVISNINVYLFVSPQPQRESIWDGKRLTASSKGIDWNVYKTDPSLNQRIVVVSIISIALLQVVVNPNSAQSDVEPFKDKADQFRLHQLCLRLWFQKDSNDVTDLRILSKSTSTKSKCLKATIKREMST